MISFEHKFIFVHVGRTGGTSFERAAGVPVTSDLRTRFLGNCDFNEKHKNFEYYRTNYPGEFDSFFKFTIVRNPFDRLVSRWLWRTTVLKETKWVDFKQFIETRPISSKYSEFYKLSEKSIIESVNQFDFIGRFEDIQNTYKFLCHRFKIQECNIPHTNKTILHNYKDYYNSDTVKLVKKIYHIDLDLFDYDF